MVKLLLILYVGAVLVGALAFVLTDDDFRVYDPWSEP